MISNTPTSLKILDNIPAYILLHNRDNQISWINTYTSEKFGLERDKVVGKSIQEIFGKDQGEKIITQNLQVFETKKSVEKIRESLKIPKQGVRWFHTQRIPIKTKDGIVSEVLAYMVDITENVTDIIAKVESETKYQNLFMSSPTPIIISDLEGKIIDINEQMSELLNNYGFDEEKFLYSHFSDLPFLDKTQVSDFSDVFQEVLALRLRRPIEIPLNLNNKEIYLEIFPSVLQQNDKPYAVQVIMQDITKRKKAEYELINREKLLRESEKKYRSLFEDSPIALWSGEINNLQRYLEDLHKNGVKFETYFDNPDEISNMMSRVKIVSVNRATLDLFKAKNKTEIIKNYRKLFPKESLLNIKHGLMGFIKGNLSHESVLLAETMENDMLILDVKWEIVVGNKEKPTTIQISMRDITEQKNFEKVLQTQRDFGIALSNIHEIDSLIKLTVNTAITVSGLEFGAMYRYDPNSNKLFLKHQISIDEELNDFFTQLPYQSKFITQNSTETSHYFTQDDIDKKFPSEFNIKTLMVLPIRYLDEFQGVFVFGSLKKDSISEVTRNILQSLVSQIGSVLSRIRIETDLIERQRRDSLITLAKGIAHDFNNILTAAVGSISLAELSVDDPQELQSQLNEAKRAMIRSRELTKKLLMYGNPRQPSKDLIQQLTDFKSLIKDTTEFVLRGSSVTCDFYLEDNLWSVVGDQVQIEQVLNNIIINAVQSMPSGGKLEVSAVNIELNKPRTPLKPGKFIKMSVKDEGVGIPKELLGKIFDPYFTTKPEGSGMGLAISNEIVRQHGGYIDIESNIGTGSTFYIYLPAIEQEKVIKPQRKESSRKPLHKGVGKILLMDDDQIILKVASKMLEKLGYEVTTAKTGEEALKLYQDSIHEKKKFKAVIMDLTIPGGLGGKETIQELLKIDPDVIGIVSSGYSTDSVMADYQRFGFSGMIAKPYKLDEITQVLSNLKI
jgi:PAS domain S-box-containing protein